MVKEGDPVEQGDVIGLSGGGHNDPHKGNSGGALQSLLSSDRQ